MEIKKIFKDKQVIILSIIFILLTVINIIYACIVQRGLTFDGIIFFLNKINFLSQDSVETLYPDRYRYCIIFLNNLPVTIGYFLCGIDSKYGLSFLYTLPLFLFPALFPYFNYLLAKRSNRYDIVIWSLFIYGLLIIPTQIWPIVEAMLAISITFLLFHYICANINYRLYDIAFITLLVIISYSSTEANIYIGPLLFLLSIFYARKKDGLKNKIITYVTGFFSLLMPIGYISYFVSTLETTYKFQTIRFFSEFTKNDFSTFYKEPYLILVLFFVAFLVLFFVKKFEIKKCTLISSVGIISILLYLLYKYNWFCNIGDYEYRVLLYIVPFFVILLIYSKDVFIKEIKEKVEYNLYLNLLIILLVFSSFNNLIQIKNSVIFSRTISEIATITDKISSKHSKKTFIFPEKEQKIKRNKYYKVFKKLYDEDYYMAFVPAFSKRYKIQSFLSPRSDVERLYPKSNKDFAFYRLNKKTIHFSHSNIIIKNEFWDLTKIAKKAKLKKSKAD